MKSFESIRTKIDFLQNHENMAKLPDLHEDETCDCGKCDGYGHVYVNGRMKLCDQSKKSLLLSDFQDAIPLHDIQEFWKKTKVVDAIVRMSNQVRVFVQGSREAEGPRCLILLGVTGCGKTQCSRSLCRFLGDLGYQSTYIEFSKLIKMKRSIDGDFKFKRFWNQVEKSSLLVIDEISQSQNESRYDEDLLREIAQNVTNRDGTLNTFLILISNLPKQEFWGELLPQYCRTRFHVGVTNIVEVENKIENDLRVK